MEKYLGPFEVIAQVGTHLFTLCLPDSMQAVHPIFHVSMLEPTHGKTIPEHSQLSPPPVEINGELEYEISEILDSKVNKCQKFCNIVYLVRWTGYKGTDKETSWILANELGVRGQPVFHSKAILEFCQLQPQTPLAFFRL